MPFDLDLLLRYGPRLLDGFVLTLQIVALSFCCGTVIALIAAGMRTSRHASLRAIAGGYIFFFRGTPLLAQAFLIYFGLGQFRETLQDIGLWWFFRDAFYCGVLALSLNTGAYMAEIIRGGILAVPTGVIEGGKALGLKPMARLRLLILPLAFRYALPGLGNELILTIKGSAVLSIITLSELMGQTRLVFSRSFALEIFFWAALLYLVLTLSTAWVVARAERHFNRHTRRNEDDAPARHLAGLF